VRRLVLATRNAHKLREFARLLDGTGVEVVPLPDHAPMPEETGRTFADNALIKARSAHAATGEAAFADDSGIGAEALEWRPGVHSARYAGPDASDADNLSKLEAEVPAGSALRYTCVIALVDADGRERLFEGTCDGMMAQRRSGSRGFGYDPIFQLGDGRTMADLADAEKDAVSHRGRAAAQLRDWLAGISAG
jgi:XTP/dITP diphosphohydrolase